MFTTLQRTPARQLIIFIAATLLLATGDSMAIEEPAFDLIEKTDAIEIRQYRPLIVAEAVVDGAMDTASSRGFRLIAAYIFGGNQSVTPKADKTSEKIAMTAPVVVEPLTSSEKIEMTAPVMVTPEGTLPEPGMQANRWRIQFVMPATYSMATLPKPTNPAVSLREVPAKRYAVKTPCRKKRRHYWQACAHANSSRSARRVWPATIHRGLYPSSDVMRF
jgi:hypothetical protein